jgi:hypothetical protein
MVILVGGAAAAVTLLLSRGQASGDGSSLTAPRDLTGPTGAGGAVSVQVDPTAVQRTIPADYLGLSLEYWTLENYAGRDPNAINPIFVRLLHDVLPPRGGIIRIGGVTTDKTWWPVHGVPHSPGVNYWLTARRLDVARALATATRSRLIMGINLEQGSAALAGAEGRAMVAHIGRGRLLAFELGNEPELFGNPHFAWYRRDGHPATGRAQSYDLSAFTRDFTRIGQALPGGVPLAGPSSTISGWIGNLDPFLTGAPRLRLVTLHGYPFAACFASPSSPQYPTLQRLLSPLASSDLASSLAPFVNIVHAHHLPLAVDEMNSISCGNPPALPNSFAMALWIVDALFADAAAGVDSVNVHTWPGAVYQLFRFTHPRRGWSGAVFPEYYGLLLFARAAPPGSRLLTASTSNPLVRAWATRGADGRIRIALINDDTSDPQPVSVTLTNTDPARVHGATLELLRAPGALAKGGVTLAGQSFGTRTSTGVLKGRRQLIAVSANNGVLSLQLPAASAGLVTVQ